MKLDNIITTQKIIPKFNAVLRGLYFSKVFYQDLSEFSSDNKNVITKIFNIFKILTQIKLNQYFQNQLKQIILNLFLKKYLENLIQNYLMKMKLKNLMAKKSNQSHLKNNIKMAQLLKDYFIVLKKLINIVYYAKKHSINIKIIKLY